MNKISKVRPARNTNGVDPVGKTHKVYNSTHKILDSISGTQDRDPKAQDNHGTLPVSKGGHATRIFFLVALIVVGVAFESAIQTGVSLCVDKVSKIFSSEDQKNVAFMGGTEENPRDVLVEEFITPLTRNVELGDSKYMVFKKIGDPSFSHSYINNSINVDIYIYDANEEKNIRLAVYVHNNIVTHIKSYIGQTYEFAVNDIDEEASGGPSLIPAVPTLEPTNPEEPELEPIK